MSNDLRRKSAEARELQRDLDAFELAGGSVTKIPVIQSNRSGGSETWFDTTSESFKASVQKGIARSNDVRRKA